MQYIDKLFNWHIAVLLHQSRVTQAISLLPVLGYIVLYSDWTRQTVESLMTFDVALPGGGCFSWETRVTMLYLGSTALFISHYFLYLPFVPKLISRFVTITTTGDLSWKCSLRASSKI